MSGRISLALMLTFVSLACAAACCAEGADDPVPVEETVR